jgi:glutathione S-transferase
MALIYHIANAADWQQARESGDYRTSTRGRSLEQQGFIHASTAEQVAPVANALYGDDQDLLVLVIDETRVRSAVRYEPVPGWEAPFPHIYGPLNVDAVVETLSLRQGDGGLFVFRAEGGTAIE